MAACPPRVAEEKGPKIRTKNQTFNASVNCSDDENRPGKLDDVDNPRRISSSETKEDDVSADGKLLETLSFCEFEGLLQEVSTPNFTNKNSAANNPLMRKLIDSKVIDPKCLEKDLNDINWLRPCSNRGGGNKEGRRGFERKSRLESYGPSSSLDGGSAASRTTQGGSLQNLHGKSEGKKSSLHKSGSLNTFPNASSDNSYEELAAVKATLAANLLSTVKKTSATAMNQSKRIRASGGAGNYGTNTCCPAVTATISVGGCSPVVVNRTQCGELKDVNSCFSTSECNSAAVAAATLKYGIQGGVFDAEFTRSTIANNEDSEMADEEKKMVMLMEVDVTNDGREGETIPLLKPNSCSMANGNGIDIVQGRTTEMTEVDARVTVPLTVIQVKQIPKPEIAVCGEEWRGSNSLNSVQGGPVTAVMNGRSLDVEIDRSKRIMFEDPARIYDNNGNIHYHTTGEYATTFNRNFSMMSSGGGRETETTEFANRGKKKSKISNKQKVINPTEIDGYFGSLPLEVILERINSTEGQDTNKLRSAVVDGKSKKAGNKSKNTSSHKEIRKNSENEIRVNGNKEDVKSESILVNDINAKDVNKITKKKSSIVADEGTSSGSHSPELDADDKERTTPKNVNSILPSDVGDLHTDGIFNVKPVQGQPEHISDNLVSSFVSDFYANTEAQSVVEDSEFHEVKKKKKKKPRSVYSSRCDGGTGACNYNRYPRYGGIDEIDSGRNSSSAASWVGISPHRRGLYNSDDVRRKSTSSMPPSDHSSPDNSDVESVHSLPAGSTTLRPTISKTSSSSSCTPQASYADIAKMTTVAVDSSSNYKFSALSPTTLPYQHHLLLNNDAELFKHNPPNATSLVPLESDETCDDEPVQEFNNIEGEIKTVDVTPDEPSIESSMSSSIERENLCDSPTANLGVEFVGGLELPEDMIEVTFGFEVNEQLLQMTEAELMAPFSGMNPEHMNDSQLHQPRTEPMIIGPNMICDFSKCDHMINQQQEIVIENQGLIISHISTPIHSASSIPIIAAPPLSVVQSSSQSESEIIVNPPVVVIAEPIYAESLSVDHQNIVDYIGSAWLKVSDELERESKDQFSKRVRYFSLD